MEMKTGGQAAAKALVDHDVKVIFTLSGGHLNPIYVNLEDTDIKYFDTRHEQAAVWMAEAYGRLTRKPGVAMVTAGPGFTNALTPVASAAMSNTPLVLIAGCVGINMIHKLDLQDVRQAPIIEPMVKKAYVCHKPERIPELIDLAFREATSGRPGPVYLELPVDVLSASPTEGSEVEFPNTMVQSRAVDREKTRLLLGMIEEAQNPIVIAGSGAWYSDAGQELERLAETIGIPLFTVANTRGLVSDDHPFCFGGATGIRPGAGLHASFGTDLVILLGTRLNLFNLFGGVYNPAARMVQVDIEPEEIGRNRNIDLPIMSDVKALAEEINQLINDKGAGSALRERFSSWVSELKEAEKASQEEALKNWESEAVPIHPMRLAREVDQFLDRDDDILVTDGGDTTTWMGMSRNFRRAGHYLDYGLFGCLGGGIPYANAAKFLYPEKRILLITGDGSVGFNFMELERSITKDIPIVVVIFNDLGWGMIRHSQEIRLGKAIESVTELGRIDYHKYVEAMGGMGLQVETPSDIRPALEQAFAFGKTACINVMTDPTTVSPGSVALAKVGAYKN